VKIVDMARKLDAIAENLKDLQIEGTTRIDWNCLTERERVLFDRIVEIQDEYKPHLPPDDVLQENHALFDKGVEIIARRAIDLFRTVMKTLYMTNAQEDPLIDFIFVTRLFWFLQEIGRQSGQMRKEEELYEKHGGSEDFERAWKEYKEKLEDKTALWSQESFERFIHPLFERTRTRCGCEKEAVGL
jgi:hypothetical protein